MAGEATSRPMQEPWPEKPQWSCQYGQLMTKLGHRVRFCWPEVEQKVSQVLGGAVGSWCFEMPGLVDPEAGS